MGRRVTAGVLLELINLIVLAPADNPQARSMDGIKAANLSHEATTQLPLVTYSVFAEVAAKLDQSGDTFEAYLARQVSTLYFLLRLAPLYKASVQDSTTKKMALLTGDDVPEGLFPDGMLGDGPVEAGNLLLANYLTESWNRFTQYGGPSNDREAVGYERLYVLVREVVRVYGWWSWPFFHHYESSEHVDGMTRLAEESNGRVPIPQG
jgi:hypothetical protein